MTLSNNELFEIADNIADQIGSNTFLNDLMKAMSSSELQSNLKFIDRMYGLSIFDNHNSSDSDY